MTQPKDLGRQLCSAIAGRRLVMFEYGDLIRVVEPYGVGINDAGHPALCGWLRAGLSRADPAGGWREYLLSDIESLEVLDAPFVGARPGYHDEALRMHAISCELVSANSAEAVA